MDYYFHNVNLIFKFQIYNTSCLSLNLMKSRNNSSKEKQVLMRKQAHLGQNYHSTRDSENNQKLANLLNLSQFYIKDMNNNSQNMATFFAGISTKNGKISNHSQSNIIGYDNHQQAKISKAQLRDQPNSHNSRGSPNKTAKNSKAKRSKSSKKNMLSCQQILNMAKKRDTWSMVALQSNKNIPISQYGTTNNLTITNKSKRKHKKDNLSSVSIANINKSQNAVNKNRIQNDTNKLKLQRHGVRDWHSALSQYEDKNPNKEQTVNNLAVNYPLSMSHSYIVFSQKDSTMNNTANMMNKMNKNLSSSRNQNKLVGLSEKLIHIKAEHAAIIIQKHWRGYLTRKLLEDYINNEQSKLIDKLSDMKTRKHNFEMLDKARQLNQQNKLWACQDDDCSQISQIKEKQLLFQQIPDHKFNFREQGFDEISQSSNFKEYQNSVQAEKKLIESSEPSSEHSEFNDNSNFSSPQSIQQCYKTNQIIQRPTGKHSMINKLYQISREVQLKILPQCTVQLNQKTFITLETKMAEFSVYLKQQLNTKIEIFKRQLSEKVKESKLQFNKMLEIREQLKTISNSLEEKMISFNESIHSIFSRVPDSWDDETCCMSLIDNSLVESPKKQLNNKNEGMKPPTPQLKVQNCWDKSIESLSGKLISTEEEIGQNESSLKKSIPNSNEKSQPVSNNSPISEYFTIELPTQELSPHKRCVSSGLENVKTFLQNLHQQYLSQPQSGSETSFLCRVLQRHSEMGPENMMERCLIQMLVQLITCQYMLQDILVAAQQLANQVENQDVISDTSTIQFVKKWADELDKWELGTIEEVSRNMEESVDVTERNNTSKRKKLVIKEWLLDD